MDKFEVGNWKKKVGKKGRARSWASTVGYIMLAFDADLKTVGLGQQLKDYEVIIFQLWYLSSHGMEL